MSSHLYRQYLKLLERWPIDPTKTGRDLGEYLRLQVKEKFRAGELVSDQKQCENNLHSLHRLADNVYAKQYPQSTQYSSCGLAPEHCRFILKNEHLEKVADFLQPEHSRIILDATFGAGGHTKELLNRSKSVKILCLDRDPLAFGYALELQKGYPDQVTPLHGKFSDLPKLLRSLGYTQNSLDGVLFDFGCSSMQFDSETRGFAHVRDAPLDMRMDGADSDVATAADVLAHASEQELHQIFKVYGEELHSRKIAKAIIEMRLSRRRLQRTSELRGLIESMFDANYRVDDRGRFNHISSKVFSALRRFVNNEPNEISYAMLMAHRYLKVGGVMVTISMHALEDKIVKEYVSGEVSSPVGTQLPLHFFSYNTIFDKAILEELKHNKWKALTKHVVVPNRYEVAVNPRSSKAKLRACRKIA